MPAGAVAVVALGGTIAMTGSTGPAGDGIAPTLRAEDLVAAVPQLAAVAPVVASTLSSVPSTQLDERRLVELADRVRALAAAGAVGVVVTQGTDTIEDTAFALELLLEVPVPVVVTGAMRGAEQPGSDGPANLLAAVRVAASPSAAGRGVLVVLNDTVHAARHVSKRHTTRPDAFSSGDAGPLGAVTESRVHWFSPPYRPVSIGAARPGLDGLGSGGTVRELVLPRVLLVGTWLGDDGALLRAALGLDPAGLVVAALGAGHVPAALVPILEEAARRRPVVLCSAVGGGQVFRETYGYPGSERDLLARGLLWGGGLSPRQARLFLAFALAAGWPRDRIAAELEARAG